MSIWRKLLKWRDLFHADIIVYQPAKVGSTFVVNNLRAQYPGKSIIHLHSFGMDRAYSLKKYEWLQGPNMAFAAFARTIVTAALRRSKGKIEVYVPMRTDADRRVSVFVEFFEEIIGSTRKAPWYGDYKYESADKFLTKSLDWAVSLNGGSAWLEKECAVFLTGRSGQKLDWPGGPVRFENRFFDVTVFSIDDAVEALRVDVTPSYELDGEVRNASSRKWCGVLGRPSS